MVNNNRVLASLTYHQAIESKINTKTRMLMKTRFFSQRGYEIVPTGHMLRMEFLKYILFKPNLLERLSYLLY